MASILAKRLTFLLGLITLILAIGPARSAVAAVSNDPGIAWTRLDNGIAYTLRPAMILGRPKGNILVVRIDPAATIFRVAYTPGQRKTVADWAVQWPGAAVIVNANYFHGRGKPIGLVKIGDDVLSAATGRSDSGQFQVANEIPSVRALRLNQAVKQASQPVYAESFEGYPLLITGSQAIFKPTPADIRSRRTIIAQDDSGHILFIVTGLIEMRLSEMTDWLLNPGLGISTALNVDGGYSSQIYLSAKNSPAGYAQGTIAVPVVLMVFPR